MGSRVPLCWLQVVQGAACEGGREGLERSAELDHAGPRGRGSRGEKLCLHAAQKFGHYPEISEPWQVLPKRWHGLRLRRPDAEVLPETA